MAEVTAAPSAPAASAAATPNGTNATPNTSQTGKATAQVPPGAGKAATEGTKEAQAQTAPEEFEEVKIGSASAKVPKEFAKTLKALEKGFHTKAQEAASYKQIMGNASPQQIAEIAKDNDKFAEFILKTRGIDVDQYSQARLARRLQQEMMSPEQRELEELRQYKAEQAKTEETRKAQEKQDADTRAEATERTKLSQGLMSALQKSSLPAEGMTPAELSYAAAKVTAYMARSIEQGMGWTWEQCVAKVEQEQEHSTKHWVSKLDPETLEAKLGREALDKWREYDVKRVTGQKAPSASSRKSPADSAASSNTPSGKKMLSEAEYREWFAKRSKSS